MIIIPGNGGIPGWVSHQEIGSQVRIELPLNWYEDNHILGFALFCLYHKESHFEAPYRIDLRLRDDRNELVHVLSVSWYECPEIHCDASDGLWVTLYPKNAIPKKYHSNRPWNFLAVFDSSIRINDQFTIKRCGFQLIYSHDYPHNNVPKLLDREKGRDDAEKNQADDHEPPPKRLRASETDLKL